MPRRSISPSQCTAEYEDDSQHLVDLDGLCWAAVDRAHHPGRSVVADGDQSQVNRPKTVPNLLEDGAVARIARKPDTLPPATYTEATPQGPPLVIAEP